MKSSETLGAISPALTKALGALENPKNTATNPHFKSKYAPLDVILNDARPVLAKHGLALIQSTETVNGWPAVTTRIVHESGEWIESEPLALPPQKDTAQGHGSGLTYSRRYSAAAILGVSSEDDDDGSRASGGGSQGRSHASPGGGPSGGSRESPPGERSSTISDGQRKYIYVLAKQKTEDPDAFIAALKAKGKVEHLRDLHWKHGKKAIDTLKLRPDVQNGSVEPPPPDDDVNIDDIPF